MQEDSKTLEEIVIVGYGTQKKVNLTGAISSIDSPSDGKSGISILTPVAVATMLAPIDEKLVTRFATLSISVDAPAAAVAIPLPKSSAPAPICAKLLPIADADADMPDATSLI